MKCLPNSINSDWKPGGKRKGKNSSLKPREPEKIRRSGNSKLSLLTETLV
jgi:hypothetical protein